MPDTPKRISLAQPTTEDHAARILREKIGNAKDLAALPTIGTAISADPDQQPLVDAIVATLKTVYDPEIPLDIYELGLIYRLTLQPTNAVKVEMTLTAPGCPVAGDIVAEVKRKLEAIPEIPKADIELVWDPPWTKARLSEDARLELGM